MKLVWSPELASMAYIDTIKSASGAHYPEAGVAEFVSATAAGWNAQLIVETWSRGGATATSIGLAVASRHTGGRHVCVVPDEESRSEYVGALKNSGMSPEVVVGVAEEVVSQMPGIEFLVVDCRRNGFGRVLRRAKVGCRGAIFVGKNAGSKAAAGFKWRSIIDGRLRLVRSVFLPIGKGLEIAHIGGGKGSSSTPATERRRRWITRTDQKTGELHAFRCCRSW